MVKNNRGSEGTRAKLKTQQDTPSILHRLGELERQVEQLQKERSRQ